MNFDLYGDQAQQNFGALLANCIKNSCILYLQGDLGTGKTTLTRGLLRGFGYYGSVRSPTYTLLESYKLSSFDLYHLDLYRLHDPQEIFYLGVRDLLENSAIWVIEWPERGIIALPPADLLIQIQIILNGRKLIFQALTVKGEEICSCVNVFNKLN